MTAAVAKRNKSIARDALLNKMLAKSSQRR